MNYKLIAHDKMEIQLKMTFLQQIILVTVFFILL